MRSSSPEVLLSGPAGTGKSRACLEKLHLLAEQVPGFRGLIVRRTRESLTEAALVTYEQHVVPDGHPCLEGPQRSHRQRYRYPNGSELVVGGLDKPGKIMSTEYDAAYVQEAIELTEPGWESITTRLRNGKAPYQQLLADTNPDAPTHWLNKRCDRGLCERIECRHEDNPVYWSGGGWTPAGVHYIAKLDRLTGPRLHRLRFGRWVQAEGVVYDGFDRAVHLIDRFEIPLAWERYWGVDFGFTHPFVCGMYARDHDGRLYLYREVYRTRRLVEDHARRLLTLFREEAAHCARRDRVPVESAERALRPRAVVCDHDAEGRATLAKHLGINTTPAKKAVKQGIEAVQSRLRVQPDGKPRLFVLRDSLDGRDPDLDEAKRPCCLVEELDCYVWDDKRDLPLDDNNHSCDQLRYVCVHADGGLWEAPSVAAADPAPLRPGDREPGVRFGDDGGRPGRLFGR